MSLSRREADPHIDRLPAKACALAGADAARALVCRAMMFHVKHSSRSSAWLLSASRCASSRRACRAQLPLCAYPVRGPGSAGAGLSPAPQPSGLAGDSSPPGVCPPQRLACAGLRTLQRPAGARAWLANSVLSRQRIHRVAPHQRALIGRRHLASPRIRPVHPRSTRVWPRKRQRGVVRWLHLGNVSRETSAPQ